MLPLKHFPYKYETDKTRLAKTKQRDKGLGTPVKLKIPNKVANLSNNSPFPSLIPQFYGKYPAGLLAIQSECKVYAKL